MEYAALHIIINDHDYLKFNQRFQKHTRKLYRVRLLEKHQPILNSERAIYNGEDDMQNIKFSQ